MSVVTGLQLPFGIQPVNPVPVDSWSGPFNGAIDTVQSAVDAANAGIPSAIRFQSMEVRLIVSGTSRKFWYRDGIDDSDLVEFSSSSSASPGGSNSSIQFNDAGSFGGDAANFSYNKDTSTLTVSNISGSLTRLSDGSSYLVAGDNISIVSSSSGQITISSTSSASSKLPAMSWMETPTGDIDGINMIFELQNSPNPENSLMFFVNGVLQKKGSSLDYVLQDNVVTLWTAPNEGSNLTATYAYQATAGLGENTSWMETPDGDVDGANTVFTIQHTPYPLSSLMFYVNGVLQVQGDNYDFLVSSNIVILKAAPTEGSNLTATYPY